MGYLNDVKINKRKINLGGEVEEIIFDFNSFALLEDIYSGIDEMFAIIDKGSIKGLRNLIWAGLSHKYIDEVTEEMSVTPIGIGKLLLFSNIEDIQEALMAALKLSMPNEDAVIAKEISEAVKK